MTRKKREVYLDHPVYIVDPVFVLSTYAAMIIHFSINVYLLVKKSWNTQEKRNTYVVFHKLIICSWLFFIVAYQLVLNIGYSGAGTNLKVGAPVRSECGGTDLTQSVGKKFFGLCGVRFHFLALKAQFVVLVNAFVMVSFCSAVFVLTVAPVPSHLWQWGGHVFPVPNAVGATVNIPLCVPRVFLSIYVVD